MDACSSISWFSELEMEDPFLFHQFETDCFEEFATQQTAAALVEEYQHSLSSESESSSPPFIPIANSITAANLSSSALEVPRSVSYHERPKKQQKPSNCSRGPSHTSNSKPSFPIILSFGNSNSSTNPQQSRGDLQGGTRNQENDATSSGDLNFSSDVVLATRGGSSFVNQIQDHATKADRGTKRSTARSPSHSRDHIIAERMRREKLSQQFIALSAIVPGLKKVDKTSVLGEAIKYMKQLQERVKTLEEQTAKKAVESVVIVKKSQILVEDDNSSSTDNFAAGCSNDQLPEIEARISGKSVLLRIHCNKQRGVLVKMLTEVERLNLAVVNTGVIPFGDSTLDITIIAMMENEFSMATQDLVRVVRSAF